MREIKSTERRKREYRESAREREREREYREHDISRVSRVSSERVSRGGAGESFKRGGERERADLLHPLTRYG